MKNKLHVLLAGPLPPPTPGGIRSLIATLLSSRLPELVMLDTFDIGEPPASYIPGRISPRRFLKLTQQLLAFYRRLRESQPHVVHIHAPGKTGLAKAGLFLLASRLQSVPTLLHLHFWPDELCLFGIKSTERVMIEVVAQADAIVAVSDELADFLRRYLPKGKRVEVLHNCINLRNWSSLQKTSSSSNGIQLLFLGDIVGERKGQYDLLQAMASSKISSETRLVLIGGDRGTGELSRARSLAHSLGLAHRCQFLGHIYGDQKNQILVDSDIFILPSHAEGQPVAVLEAMAAGLPIIASRVGAIPDVVKDGENGILVEPGDIGALAGAINRLVDDGSARDRMAAKSLEFAPKYGVQPYLQRLMDLYEGAA